MSIELISIALASVAAISAAISGIANMVLAGRTSRTHQAQLLLAFADRYRQPEMNEALKTLYAYWEQNGSNVDQVRAAILRERDTDITQFQFIKQASRVVCLHFIDIARAYESKLVSRRLARTLLSVPALNAFYEIAEPIATIVNPTSLAAKCRPVLEKIQPDWGDGLYQIRNQPEANEPPGGASADSAAPLDEDADPPSPRS